MATPADQRLLELLEKWLTSLELHAKYCSLDDSSYAKVQPWRQHQRPSRWIIDLARQNTLALRAQVEERIAMRDAKFSESLELMTFLANLVGCAHIERFIPLAEPADERPLGLEPGDQPWDDQATSTHELSIPDGWAHDPPPGNGGSRGGQDPGIAASPPGNSGSRRGQDQGTAARPPGNGGSRGSQDQGIAASPPGNGGSRGGQDQGIAASPPGNSGSPSGQDQGIAASPPGNGGSPGGQDQGIAASPPGNGGSRGGQDQGTAASMPGSGTHHGDRQEGELNPAQNGGGAQSERQPPAADSPGNGSLRGGNDEASAASMQENGNHHGPRAEHQPSVAKPALGSPRADHQPSVAKPALGSPRADRQPPPTMPRNGSPNGEHQEVAKSTASLVSNRKGPSAEARELVIADAARLVRQGRRWYELADLIAGMADRPPLTDVRRILKDNKAVIELKAGRT
jgi:hypothetical protein